MAGGPLIVVDWGTTSFRAWLVDETGAIVDEVPSGIGMRDLEHAEFPGYCGARVARWRTGMEPPPIYMAGMVGAPQGWLAAPQPPLPLRLADLARDVVAADGLPDAWIVPGARIARPGGDFDVMRGEEVQIFGALALCGRADGLLCLPGTHSKWATVADDTLSDFFTLMTGEVFQVMREHSILAKTAARDAAFDAEAFRAGLAQAGRPGGLLHAMFTTRADALYGDLPPERAPSYLSGILIGEEVRAMSGLHPKASEIVLVCGDALREPYDIALAAAGFAVRPVAAKDASLAGIRAVAALHRANLE